MELSPPAPCHAAPLRDTPPAPSPSGRRNLKWFVLLLLAFWLPPAGLFGLIEILFWRAGETWPVGRVLARQAAVPDALFLREYLGQDFAHYKWRGVLTHRPDLLVLGSSRVMQFRQDMFTTGSSDYARSHFYNGGGLIQSIDDLESFAAGLPREATPKVLILGIDMWWLNDALPRSRKFAEDRLRDSAFNWQAHLRAFRQLLLHPGTSWSRILGASRGNHDDRRIGLAAKLNESGFRADGSFEYGVAKPPKARDGTFRDREMPPVTERIRTAVMQFKPTTGASPDRLFRLARALAALRDGGTLIIGFNPPISSESAKVLERTGGQRQLWRDYRQKIPEIFAGLRLPFFDASTPAALGLDDRYMLDGFHAAEPFHLHLLRRFLLDPRVRTALPGLQEEVERALKSHATNYRHAGF